MSATVDKNFEISQKSLMHNSVFCRLFSCRLTTQLPHYKYFSRSFARSEFVVALYQDQLDKYNILIYTSRTFPFSAIRSLSFLRSNIWKRKTVCRENAQSLVLNVLQYFFFHDNIVGESDAHSLVQKEKCGFKIFDFLKVVFPKIIEYPGLTANSNDPLCFHHMNCLNFFNSEELVNHC